MQLPDKKTSLMIGAALLLGAGIAAFIGYAAWTAANLKVRNLESTNESLRNSYKSLNDYYNQQYANFPKPTTPEPSYPQREPEKTQYDITWATKPTLLNSDEVDFYIKNTLPDTMNYSRAEETNAIVIGKFNASSTVHPDWRVIRAIAYNELGMGTWEVYKFFAISPDQSMVAPLPDDILPRLDETDFPAQLTLPNGKIVKRGYSEETDQPLYATTDCLRCAVTPQSPAITAKEGIKLYVRDGAANAYDKFGRGMTYYDQLPEGALESIRFTASNSTTTRYMEAYPAPGGCSGSPAIATDEQLGTLKAVGTLSTGETIYTPADLKNSDLVKRTYDAWFPTYNYQYDDSAAPKPSFEEYLERYPIPFFVRKNAFGTWITYSSTEAVTIAECGKPVIYLYPEKETPVSVRLPSSIKVTVSDPTYPVGGWNVLAKPDGSLLYEDGKTYGSLFWEGTGVNYEVPKTGFVVKHAEVESFLSSILPRYGMNKTETKEFMDFWVSKFTGAPYYRVSFLTDDWNKAAPLYVTPKPQTSIRIFMDFQPLAGPIDIEEPIVTAPARNGFTLVEWGGLLRK